MADEVRTVEHYTIDVKDEPGAGSHALGILRDNDINLVALWGYPAGPGVARLELVPEDAEGFVAAAKAGGLEVGEPSTAFYVTGDDRRGAMADKLEKLSKAGVNVAAAHAVADRGRFGAVIFVAAADLQKAAAALYST